MQVFFNWRFIHTGIFEYPRHVCSVNEKRAMNLEIEEIKRTVTHNAESIYVDIAEVTDLHTGEVLISLNWK